MSSPLRILTSKSVILNFSCTIEWPGKLFKIQIPTPNKEDQINQNFWRQTQDQNLFSLPRWFQYAANAENHCSESANGPPVASSLNGAAWCCHLPTPAVYSSSGQSCHDFCLDSFPLKFPLLEKLFQVLRQVFSLYILIGLAVNSRSGSQQSQVFLERIVLPFLEEVGREVHQQRRESLHHSRSHLFPCLS